jgi:arylsulfatase
LVIVLDDLGFAQLGCFGSDLDTPNLDRLAARGVRFTNFHTTAVCSPTRACLLTGRSHHRVGMGMLPDLPVNFPGYTGEFPDNAATMAEILRARGWSTTAIGKWHLTPRDQRAEGPFHMWPTGVGFDRYYGFLNGETSQWTPNLVRDQTHVEPPSTPDEGYHLDKDLADEAISQLRALRLANTERPFLMWFASGSPHAPHQVPAEWIERFAGRFDDGWDTWREQTFARQKAMGIVPDHAELSERPKWVEPWAEIDPDRQRLYSRMMEVFAAFLAHTDHQLGRVLDHLEASGDAENTVVMMISDNGCSAEGGPNGSWNQIRHYISDLPDDLPTELAHIDDLGGHRSCGHYPWGWALAGNTPFRRWKRYTFEGGVRDPLIISWPGHYDDGSIRSQYCHVTDLLPTLLDLVEVPAPEELEGIEQMSIDGTSLRPVLDDAGAGEVRTSQYFECWGSRAVYVDGWKAVTNHVNQLTAAERDHIEGAHTFADDTWQLFDTTSDFSEQYDLAEAEPERLAELVAFWNEEAERNQVLPIDDGMVRRPPHMRLPWMQFRDRFDLVPGDKLHEVNGPMLWGGFVMTAAFPGGTGQGISGTIAEQGDWIAGWAMYTRNGSLRWCAHIDGQVHDVGGEVPPGTRLLAVTATPAADGSLSLEAFADDRSIGTGLLPYLPRAWSPDGAFLTVGYSRPFPVVDDYEPPFPAPPELHSLRVVTGPRPEFDFAQELADVLRHQ